MPSIDVVTGAPDTVWCPGQGTNELVTFGFSERRSAIIYQTVRCAPDSVRWANGATVTCAQRPTAKLNSARSEVIAGSENAPDMSDVPPDCPVQLQDKDFNGQPLQTPTGS
jgi:hypothetical protein